MLEYPINDNTEKTREELLDTVTELLNIIAYQSKEMSDEIKRLDDNLNRCQSIIGGIEFKLGYYAKNNMIPTWIINELYDIIEDVE